MNGGGVHSLPAFHFAKKICPLGFFAGRQQCMIFQSTRRSHVSFENVKLFLSWYPRKRNQPSFIFKRVIFLKTLQNHRTLGVPSAFCPICSICHFGKIEGQNIYVINFLSKQSLTEMLQRKREKFCLPSYVEPFERILFTWSLFLLARHSGGRWGQNMEVVRGQRLTCSWFTAVPQQYCTFSNPLILSWRSAALKGSQNFGIGEQIYLSNKRERKKKKKRGRFCI